MADSATQQPPPAPPTRSVAELAAELQKMKRAKIWWWQRDDILKARMSTAVVAWVLLSIVLTICTVFRSTPSIYQFNHRLIPRYSQISPSSSPNTSPPEKSISSSLCSSSSCLSSSCTPSSDYSSPPFAQSTPPPAPPPHRTSTSTLNRK